MQKGYHKNRKGIEIMREEHFREAMRKLEEMSDEEFVAHLQRAGLLVENSPDPDGLDVFQHIELATVTINGSPKTVAIVSGYGDCPFERFVCYEDNTKFLGVKELAPGIYYPAISPAVAGTIRPVDEVLVAKGGLVNLTGLTLKLVVAEDKIITLPCNPISARVTVGSLGLSRETEDELLGLPVYSVQVSRVIEGLPAVPIEGLVFVVPEAVSNVLGERKDVVYPVFADVKQQLVVAFARYTHFQV